MTMEKEGINKATIILVIGIMLIGVNATIVTSTFDGLISEGMADNVAQAYTQDELIDDDWVELELIQKHVKGTVAISSFGNPKWKHKCIKALGMKVIDF